LRLAVHAHLNERQALVEHDRKGLRNHLFSIAFYTASSFAGLFFPRLTLALIALLTLFWVLPNMSLRNAGKEQDA
jgi:hypothetical protein